MEPVKSSSIDETIIFTKILEDGRLLVVDSNTTVRILDKETLKVKSGFKVNIPHERYATNVVDFTSDAKHFVTLTQDSKESRLYNTKSKKIVSVMDRHSGEISCVGIDPKNRYVISGGEDGKVFAVDIKSGQHSFNLPKHIDTINDIVFSQNGQLAATAGYDKKIFIFNLAMLKQKHKLRAHSSPIVKLLFIDNNRFFSVDKRGSGIIWNIEDGRVIKRLDGIHDDVTQVTVSSDSHFLFIGSKLGYIMVFDLQTYEMVDKRYLKFDHTVSSLNFDESTNQLIVGTSDGQLYFYEIYSGEKYINELIRQKKYAGVEEYVSENPILKYTESYNTMNHIWDRTVENAKKLLGNNDKASAIRVFDNFVSIPIRKQHMNKLVREYEEFEKFMGFVKQGKLALAYGLANKHPVYKESSIYSSMEAGWKKAFLAAQKYLLEPKGYDRAKDILAPYRGISEKTVLIQGLMSNAEVHKRFKTAIGQKDFKLCYELLKQHPFLKEYSEYDTLTKYADTLYEKSQTLINQGDTHAAIKLIEVLVDFAEYKDDAKEMLEMVRDRQKFFHSVENDDMIAAYNFLDTHDALLESEDGKRLQEAWDSDVIIADEYASVGSIEGVRDSLDKYMKIESKIIAIATIVSWCYITQLQNALDTKESQNTLENGIKNYVLYFGLTEQIFGFYDLFKSTHEDTKLYIDSLAEGSVEKWRPSMIVKSILD